ncbi:MAG: hypothetical protein Q4B44_02110 [Erysipelotrichaceae bacterium]|nr:hypothetical protein [Erysipelotrichaceae bacterium]
MLEFYYFYLRPYLPWTGSVLYSFLVFWIIPCYPSYRKCFRISLRHFLTALLCALGLTSFIFIFQSGRRWEFMWYVPLLAAISYVDQRDQEIPDLPMFLILLVNLRNIGGLSYVFATMMFAVLYLFSCGGYLGLGDVKLICSWVLIKGANALLGLILGCLVCIIVSKLKKEPPETKIPFGPYICAGMFSTLFLPF